MSWLLTGKKLLRSGKPSFHGPGTTHPISQCSGTFIAELYFSEPFPSVFLLPVDLDLSDHGIERLASSSSQETPTAKPSRPFHHACQ